MLGVATLEEGIEIREAGITIPVLVMGLIAPTPEQLDAVVNYDLSQTVADHDLAAALAAAAAACRKRITVHLKVDTGMGRIGCRPEEAAAIAGRISRLGGVDLEGIYTHFPAADEDPGGFSQGQITLFRKILDELNRSGITIPIRHIANSAGTVNFHDPLFNMIRPGIMAYGYSPGKNFRSPVEITPSMTLKSGIIFMKRVPAGTPISYGLTYRTGCESNIATLPVGYGDGYPRSLSNRGRVMIGDKIYPVAGRVTMDQILIDLGSDSYPLGQEVVLFGPRTITVNEVAEWAGTIPYEITCNISKRVPRMYLG